jgi:tetratricopeptide (TPR) repeat protein
LKCACQLALIFCCVLANSAQTPTADNNQGVPEATGANRRALSPDDPGSRPEMSPLLLRLARCDVAESRRKLIIEAITRHDYKTAEQALVDEINQKPSSPELLSIAAGVFFLDHDFWNSAIALKKADVLRPLSPADRFALCLSFIALNHGDWAKPELERLVKEHPEEPKYLYWLARIDYDDRRYLDSVFLLEEVIRLAPDNAKAYDNLGLSLEGSGRIDEALKRYAEAVRLNRQLSTPSPWPPLNQGTLLSRIGRNEDAERSLREALQYAPDLAQAHFRLGVLYDKEGHESEAIAELKQAVSLDRSYPDPLYALTRIYRHRGEERLAEQALAEFKRLHSLQRDQPTKN